jgi:hypothetical protein
VISWCEEVAPPSCANEANPRSFIDDTPTAKPVRQVLGAVSEFDKAMTVAKLRSARERKLVKRAKFGCVRQVHAGLTAG